MKISEIQLLHETKTVSAFFNGKLQNHKEVNAFDEFMKSHLNEGVINFILDLSNVTMLSSYSLAIFAIHMNSIHENLGKLVICNPNSQPENTLRLVSFHKKLIITKTHQEALKHIETA